MTKATRNALILWAVITCLIVSESLWIYTRHGLDGFQAFMQEGPYTNIPITLASVAFTWLMAGFLLWLVSSGRLRRGNLLGWSGFFIVAFSYINMLRERVRYGDIDYYIQAASNLFHHQTLPVTYLYPPLWATLLSFLVPYGDESILVVAWVANLLSLFLFYLLLIRTLERYEFDPHAAALTALVFILVNMPIMRTLMYVQVNLHVMNLILLSLLLYKDRPFLSAVALALAVHLKASPAVLILAFLLEFNWKWLAWFIFSMLVLTAFTLAIYGATPFFDFINNFDLLNAPRTLSMRDNSFDSAIGVTLSYFRADFAATRALVLFAKVVTAVVAIILSLRARVFYPAEESGTRLFNSVVPLFIAMTLSAPLMWEHHGVFVALPALLLIRKLASPAEWTFFGTSYLAVFLLPTFDYYPWSYARLLGILILLVLLWITRNRSDNALFPAFNAWAASLSK